MKTQHADTNLGFIDRLHKKGVTWLILFVVFFAANPNTNYLFKLFDSVAFVIEVMLLVTLVNKVLIHYLLARQKTMLFIVLSFFAVLIMALLSAVIRVFLLIHIAETPIEEIMSHSPFPFLLDTIWFIAVYAVTLIFYYQRKENEDRIAADQLKSEKLDMELRYLKSQINPHFLFNAMNNIYSMVYMNDENAADGVLKLSEMLRYVLVDCQADVIPLAKEVKYVENFIDFQMMRMEKECNVKFEKDIENENFMIAPMLLQPIVENCFKYSRLESNPDGYVHIRLMQKGSHFSFEAENSVAQNIVAVASNHEAKSGIGQKNVRQRLMLHYGENYRFDIEQNTGKYKVTIAI